MATLFALFRAAFARLGTPLARWGLGRQAFGSKDIYCLNPASMPDAGVVAVRGTSGQGLPRGGPGGFAVSAERRAYRWVKHGRNVLGTGEHSQESHGGVAVVASSMPLRPCLEEGGTGLEALP